MFEGIHVHDLTCLRLNVSLFPSGCLNFRDRRISGLAQGLEFENSALLFWETKTPAGCLSVGRGGHALELTQLTFRVLLTGVIRSAKALDAKPRLCSRIPFDLVFPHRCGVNRNPAKPIRVGYSASGGMG